MKSKMINSLVKDQSTFLEDQTTSMSKFEWLNFSLVWLFFSGLIKN